MVPDVSKETDEPSDPMQVALHPVNRLKPVHLEQAAKVLALAFQDDPLMAYICKDPRKRVSLVELFYKIVLKLALLKADPWYIADEHDPSKIASVSVWVDSESSKENAWDYIKAGGWRLFFRKEVFRMARLFPVFKKVEKMREKNAPDHHYYLSLFGTHPDYQGKGYGASILRKMHDYQNTRGVFTYLETMTQENVELYAHFGYETVEMLELEKYGLSIFGLKREATL